MKVAQFYRQLKRFDSPVEPHFSRFPLFVDLVDMKIVKLFVALPLDIGQRPLLDGSLTSQKVHRDILRQFPLLIEIEKKADADGAVR
jgi:hypothetical protein